VLVEKHGNSFLVGNSYNTILQGSFFSAVAPKKKKMYLRKQMVRARGVIG